MKNKCGIFTYGHSKAGYGKILSGFFNETVMDKKTYIQKLRMPVLTLLMTTAMPMAAQFHQSINVEGKYVPDVIRADRINTFPKALRQTLLTQPIEYEQGGVATSFRPSLLTMPATGWQATREVNSNPGYIELGAGSWLNTDLSAGYRFIDNASTLFGARLQFNSTSMWKPEISPSVSDVKQERYDGSLGLYASHVFKNYGRLDVAFDYHAAYFNYYGFDQQLYLPDGSLPVGDKMNAPTQTLNDVAFRLDWRSPVTPATTLAYYATARIRHFGYRAMPIPYYRTEAAPDGGRETDLGLAGGVRMPWGNGSSIGLDSNLDILFLGGGKNLIFNTPETSDPGFSRPETDDYGMFTITPYYRFTRGLLDVRVGADIDLAFNAGPDGNRYSFLHVAPDVNFAIQTGQVGLYLNVVGGSQLNTLARLHELDYYGMPALAGTRPSYTPIDASLGVNLGPFSGLSLGIEGRFKSMKNVPLGGWYQTWLNRGTYPVDGLQPALPAGASMLYSLDSDGLDIHGVAFAGRMEYKHGELFNVSVEGSVQPQDGKKGYFNGYDRPKITALVKASVRPVSPLRLTARYDFRGKRNIYTRSVSTLGTGGSIIEGESAVLHSLHLPDLTLLGISASWSFTPSLSVWLQADNLLNRHDGALPGLPTQGITFTGGFSWSF